jgi:hypothetical protein
LGPEILALWPTDDSKLPSIEREIKIVIASRALLQMLHRCTPGNFLLEILNLLYALIHPLRAAYMIFLKLRAVILRQEAILNTTAHTRAIGKTGASVT